MNQSSLEQILSSTRPDSKEWISLPYVRRILRDFEGHPISINALFYLGEQLDKKGLPKLDIVPFWVRSKKGYRYYFNRLQILRLQDELRKAKLMIARCGPEYIVEAESRIFGMSYRAPHLTLGSFVFKDQPRDLELLDNYLPEIIREEEFDALRQSTLLA